MRLANKSLTHADADVVPQQFNSIYKQHASIGSAQDFLYSTFEDYYKADVVIDLRGKSLKQGDLEDGAVRVDSNYGNVSHLCAPTTVISAFAKDYYETQRIMMGGNGFNGAVNTVPKVISTTLGDVQLVADKFMKAEGAKKATTPSTSTKAPAAPTISAVALVSDATAKFTAAEAGNVFYAVSAVNRYGESNLTVFATAVSLTAGQAVNITLAPGVSAIAASGYTVYRTKVTTAGTPGALEFFPIFSLSEAARAQGYDGGASGIVRDRGYFLPDTEQAFMTEISDQVLSFKQLAPISKLDLAVQSMSRRFIAFLFGTPQVYAPKKIVRYINVGKTYTA